MGDKLDAAIEEVKAKIRRWEARNREHRGFVTSVNCSESETVIDVLKEVLEMMESIDE